MTLTDITTSAQATSSTGPLTGTADVSAVTGEFSIVVLILAMTASSATIAIEDSAAGDFSDAIARHSWTITGPLGASQAHHVTSYDPATSGGPNTPPAWRYGSSNNAMRINVTAITGGSITAHAILLH